MYCVIDYVLLYLLDLLDLYHDHQYYYTKSPCTCNTVGLLPLGHFLISSWGCQSVSVLMDLGTKKPQLEPPHVYHKSNEYHHYCYYHHYYYHCYYCDCYCYCYYYHYHYYLLFMLICMLCILYIYIYIYILL